MGIRQSAIVVMLSFVMGCETVPHVEEAIEAGGLERWGCGDSYEGCGFLRECPVKLTAHFDHGSGTVEFAGTTSYTRFEVRGLTRRWDWCLQDDGFGCAFVIDTEGGGRYYDFRDAMADADGATRTKPSELFKCTRRRGG